MIGPTELKRLYTKTTKVIKDFLLSPKSKEFLFFLFFVFISGAFWLLQALNDDYETNVRVPLRLKGIPNDVIITSEPPSHLDIQLKDKGFVLFNYSFTKKFFPIVLDFEQYRNKNNQIRILSTELEKKITPQLNTSTNILEISPDTIELFYSTGTSKQVPITIKGKVTPEREYYIPHIQFNPDSVLVYAPNHILDSITCAYTNPLKVENISDTTTIRATLEHIKGAKFVPNEVDITFPVDIYTEKSIEIPVRGLNFPNNKVLRAFPSKVKVTFQIGLSQFKNISEDDFLIGITYNESTKSSTFKYKIELKKAPRNIMNVRFSPEEIDYLIEQVDDYAD